MVTLNQCARDITALKQACLGVHFLTKMFAFVHIFVESLQMDDVVESLQKIPNIEELFHVTGEFDVVSIVSAENIEQFRDVLKNKIMKISGVRSTVSSIVLHYHCEIDSSPGIPAVLTA